MAIKVNVKGAAALRRKLRRMPLDFTEEIKNALIEVADETLGEMQQRAPVSEWWDTKERGHLRDALDADVDHKRLRAKIGLVTARARNLFFYGRFLEFGTWKMSARPFVFPAWMARRESARRKFLMASRTAFKKATGRKYSDVELF